MVIVNSWSTSAKTILALLHAQASPEAELGPHWGKKLGNPKPKTPARSQQILRLRNPPQVHSRRPPSGEVFPQPARTACESSSDLLRRRGAGNPCRGQGDGQQASHVPWPEYWTVTLTASRGGYQPLN